jgi:hypothetical protein
MIGDAKQRFKNQKKYSRFPFNQVNRNASWGAATRGALKAPCRHGVCDAWCWAWRFGQICETNDRQKAGKHEIL